jgi:hypothetical protein
VSSGSPLPNRIPDILVYFHLEWSWTVADQCCPCLAAYLFLEHVIGLHTYNGDWVLHHRHWAVWIGRVMWMMHKNHKHQILTRSVIGTGRLFRFRDGDLTIFLCLSIIHSDLLSCNQTKIVTVGSTGHKDGTTSWDRARPAGAVPYYQTVTQQKPTL